MVEFWPIFAHFRPKLATFDHLEQKWDFLERLSIANLHYMFLMLSQDPRAPVCTLETIIDPM